MNSLLGLLAVAGLGIAYLLQKSKEDKPAISPNGVLSAENGMRTVIVDSEKPAMLTSPTLKPIVSTKTATVATPVVVQKTAPTLPKIATVKATSTPAKAAKVATVKKATTPKTTTAKTASVTTAKTAPKATSVRLASTASVAKAPAKTVVLDSSSAQKTAAKNLDAYLVGGGLSRTTVAKYQGQMGGLKADGVAGPLTEKRAEVLLGKDVKWPHIEAAKGLYNYYVKQGFRNKTSIKNYQKKMGELVVDGIVGTKTKARVRALTDINWT